MAEAVKRARSSGKPLSELARDLGVSTETLRNWLKQEQIDTGKRGGVTTDEREELRGLRKENKVLKEEREVLRKASQRRPGLFEGHPEAAVIFSFIEIERTEHFVALMCRVKSCQLIGASSKSRCVGIPRNCVSVNRKITQLHLNSKDLAYRVDEEIPTRAA